MKQTSRVGTTQGTTTKWLTHSGCWDIWAVAIGSLTNCSRGQDKLRIRIQKLGYVIYVKSVYKWVAFLLGPDKRACAVNTAHCSLYNHIALPEYYQSRARLRFNQSYTYCLLDWMSASAIRLFAAEFTVCKCVLLQWLHKNHERNLGLTCLSRLDLYV